MAQPWVETPVPASASVSEREALLEKQYSQIILGFPLRAPQVNLANLTIYEILVQANETKELLKQIHQHSELAAALNDTAKDHTIWAPTDEAFSKHGNAESLPAESWKAIIQYHISPYALPTRRLLQMGNMPTLLRPPQLNGEQRLRLRPTFAGMQADFDATITQSDIMASNGVVHFVDTVMLPPPSMMQQIASLSTGEFSLVQRALHATGLAKEVDKVQGGTLFAPSNAAFEQLGTEANRFLFETDVGGDYLRAMLKFHFAPAQTLYSNALYSYKRPDPSAAQSPKRPEPVAMATQRSSSQENPLDKLRTGTRIFTLSTLLEGHDLHVQISRFGSAILMLPNPWTPVTTQDYTASNGVVHLIGGVLLPSTEKAAVNVDVEELKLVFAGVYDM